MPLWRVATAPDDLDAGADADDPAEDSSFIHLSPLKSTPSSSSSASTPGGAGPRDPPPGSSSGGSTSPVKKTLSGPFLVAAELPANMNKNTSWFSMPGVWTMYCLILLLVWLLTLATLGCSASTACLLVNCMHALVTFYLFHWKKGSPFADDDQKDFDKLTWWEQMDSGRQLTRNRKFLTLVPVVLFAMASMSTGSDQHSHSVMFLNTILVFVLVIAKLPLLHKIRIFGINS